ncbi:MAG: rRNA maturation RNase YbeY [Flavobacteriales bacterium]|nr:rRNA maturation RNase YbeY [Flavobacteriales bacterium]
MHRQWLNEVISQHQMELGDLSIVFCTDPYLLEINRTHLQHDYFTDIITFDYCTPGMISGELFISIDRVKDNAKTHHALFLCELKRVMVHGVLHLLGLKDKTESEEKQMRKAEDRWISTYPHP